MNYAQREKLLLAPYAMHAADSAGRGSPEPEHPFRSPYQRDRDRVTHSSAFRRLSQKTQVFTGELVDPGVSADYHRTRLTHTLEATSIARTIARALRLNEDLVEALALAHDVGHPPFGHAGEEVLNERLEAVGGFNHNRQAVRIFELLERRYPGIRGLNLTREVMEGQQSRGEKKAPSAAESTADRPARSSLLEVQVVDAADSIAYDAHDIDDALEAGLLGLEELKESPLWLEAVRRAADRFTVIDDGDLRRVAVRELIDLQVGDLVGTLTEAVRSSGVDSPRAVARFGLRVEHSRDLGESKRQLEALLFRSVYRHPRVLEHRRRATQALHGLIDTLLADPGRLPEPFDTISQEDSPERAVGDYVSSLTDRAVLRAEHASV